MNRAGILRADQMAAAVASGETVLGTSRQFGVTVQAVQNACRRRGVKSTWPRGRPKINAPDQKQQP